MPNKHYITADQLLQDSFKLGLNILDDGYSPDFIVGVWRGGAPVGIAVQELLNYFGVESDHIAIRTSLYTGINERADSVKVPGLNYLIKNLRAQDRLLIVDDVFETGRSVQQVIIELEKACRENMPEIRIATPYFKPSLNQTNRRPDYYLYQTEEWLVFPHELKGLTVDEIIHNKPGTAILKNRLICTKPLD